MSHALTIAEINAQYDSQWVLVEDPQTDDALVVQSGRVVAHSKDRDEVYRHAANAGLKRFAVLYTGEASPNAAIIL